ncbi:rhamnulokinase [Streptodolium elevatio]|uniref:Rhamnulokinase family protein n=1 Tax=Streptodolium elevatio TaxID=3157996 RepID=A0ABV3DEN1_9ACTN
MSTPSPLPVFAAIDIGASSGRVIAGRVAAGRGTGGGPPILDLTEVHRFPNRPVRVRGTLHWDILGLYGEALDGLRKLGAGGVRPASVGIDTWAVDYGLLDARGDLLANPVHYRDGRTDGVMDRVLSAVPARDIYRTTGLQFLPFNTLYQLAAEAPERLGAARELLLIPDLLAYWLTGRVGAERTNASTTQLYDVRSGTWSTELAARAGIPVQLLPPLHDPGTRTGTLTADSADATGLDPSTPVVAVGSHDTASAVVGVPARGRDFAYISCGTWSLVGVELDKPVLTEESRAANFTNEAGVDGTIRYLRNVMGLWILQECLRVWQARGLAVDLPALLEQAAREEPFRSLVDPDDPEFLPPGDMPVRIAAHCERTGQPVPQGPAAVVRCVVESLALAYRRTVRDAVRLSGTAVETVHLVGGGARNELLCQLTADACGVPVVAGPVEATAIGNVLVQARAAGVVSDLTEMRELTAATQSLHRYAPGGTHSGRSAWDAAERRLG